jgi:rRNA maturation endonuclease Nob1
LYYCTGCEKEFQASHSIHKKLEECAICNSENSLIRKPSTVFIGKKIDTSKPSQVGNVVKQSIEESRDELRQEKERLKKREYKND